MQSMVCPEGAFPPTLLSHYPKAIKSSKWWEKHFYVLLPTISPLILNQQLTIADVES
jgi:hypothetical protein